MYAMFYGKETLEYKRLFQRNLTTVVQSIKKREDRKVILDEFHRLTCLLEDSKAKEKENKETIIRLTDTITKKYLEYDDLLVQRNYYKETSELGINEIKRLCQQNYELLEENERLSNLMGELLTIQNENEINKLREKLEKEKQHTKKMDELLGEMD